MSLSQVIIIIIIGIFTGILTGLTGASGVMVVVPFLNVLLHYSIHQSIGISLVVNVISALAISIVYLRHGNVNLKAGLWIAAGTIIGAQVGTLFAHGIKSMGLSISFGIFMVLMGIALIWRNGYGREEDKTHVSNL
jgi:uncharacterized membrane protein YfcA